MKKRILVLSSFVCFMMGSIANVSAGTISAAEQLAIDVLPIEVYEENGYKVEDYRIDEKLNGAVVDGEKLTFGMSYQDILDKGFMPKDQSFSSDEFSSIGKFADFVDRDGNRIELRFHGEEGTEVADSATLIGIVHKTYISCDSSEMRIGEISTKTSKLNDILAAFGNPYSIDEESDGSLVLIYENTDKEQPKITFHIDPETNGIIYMSIE